MVFDFILGHAVRFHVEGLAIDDQVIAGGVAEVGVARVRPNLLHG